jgi:hypothetical protein
VKPHHDVGQKPADISKIIDLALEYNPMMATADLSTPYVWCNAGCDIELDILPVMKEIMAKRKDRKISTFSYFTNPIMASRDKRGVEARLEKKPLDPKTRYERLIWLKGVNISISSDDEKFIKEMESHHE